MKKLCSHFQHRIVWTASAALLAMVAGPAVLVLVLKALGIVHGTSLHTWLLDVPLNVDGSGAAGAGGAAAGSGGFSPNNKDVDPNSTPFKWFNPDPDPTSSPGPGTPAGGGGGDGGKGGEGGDPGGLGSGTDAARHTWIDAMSEFVSAVVSAIQEGAGEVLAPVATMVEGAEQMEKGSQEIQDSHGATGGSTPGGGILNESECSDGTYLIPGGPPCPN
jgi:hypothetical protein